MARTNYSYEKRQKELARQKKQAEKLEERRLRKLEKQAGAVEGEGSSESSEAETSD